MATTSKIKIASNALVLLGHPPISAFTEPGAGVAAVANLYDVSYENMLSLNRWRFAVKISPLSRLIDEPLNGFKYQYQLPSDMLYLIKVDTYNDYEVYGDKLHSNQSAVTIEYTHKVDEALLPAYFAKAFELYLASQLAIPVTANSTRAEFYAGAYKDQLTRAFYLDATQRPQDYKETSEYVDVRN